MCSLYIAFGLVIRSYIPLPYLLEGAGEPDVLIERETMAETLPESQKPCAFVSVAPGCCLQVLPGHGRFFITADKIVVEQFPGADENLLHLFLLRSSMGILMQLRGGLVLRGSSVEIDGRGVVIVAPACTGSSTLATALVQRGAKLISDELCVIVINSQGKPELIPYYPGIFLWRDMAESFEFLTENSKPVREGVEKYLIQLPESFSSIPVPVTSLFSLWEHNKREPSLESVTGLDKVKVFLSRSSHYRLLEGSHLRQQYFNRSLALLSHSSTWRLTRPSGMNSYELLAQTVEGGL